MARCDAAGCERGMLVNLAGLVRTVAIAALWWLAISGAIVLVPEVGGTRHDSLMPYVDHAERIAIVARDGIWARGCAGDPHAGHSEQCRPSPRRRLAGG